jgi:hypothetical protein
MQEGDGESSVVCFDFCVWRLRRKGAEKHEHRRFDVGANIPVLLPLLCWEDVPIISKEARSEPATFHPNRWHRQPFVLISKKNSEKKNPPLGGHS